MSRVPRLAPILLLGLALGASAGAQGAPLVLEEPEATVFAPRPLREPRSFTQNAGLVRFDGIPAGTMVDEPLGHYGLRIELGRGRDARVWSDHYPRRLPAQGRAALSNAGVADANEPSVPAFIASKDGQTAIRMRFEVPVNRAAFEMRRLEEGQLNVLLTSLSDGQELGTLFFDVSREYQVIGLEGRQAFDELRIEFTNPAGALFSIDNVLHELDLRDADRDGWPDFVDTCPRRRDLRQMDSDGDGAGDACDPFPFDPQDDEDYDGVPAPPDNCPQTFNPAQGDSDSDGVGDTCDRTAGSDQDGDGVPDSIDNCPLDFNPEQADCDADGVGDVCDGSLVEPASFEVTLPRGGSITIEKSVCLPPSPPVVDVVIAVDVTGSMGGEIRLVRQAIVSFVNRVRHELPFSNIRFGLITLRDYPGSYDSCDYDEEYSRAGDVPFEVVVPVGSPDIQLVQGINGLRAQGGRDFPEAYGRALWELTQPDSGVGFRSGAARFVLLIGDAPPHDCDLAFGMGGCIPRTSTGVDPGRDGIAFTDDDLDFQTDVMTALKNARTRLLTVYSNPVGFCTWERWTAFTGGAAVRADSTGQLPAETDLGRTLVELIRTPVVDGVTYSAETPCDLEVTFDPPFIVGPIDVSQGARVSFLETIRVPEDLPPEITSLDCTVRILANGFWIGDQTIHVRLECQETVLDFETEDDMATPIANAQALSTPPEFGRLVHISSAGPNLGPATFDSTPGGPNDPSVNHDMLIGHGNLLILQDSRRPAQSSPGRFDVPTDDPDGGDLIFDFIVPIEPKSILLIDINPPPNRGASVVLRDGAGRRRIYTVDPGWTGTWGDAGPHRLDLRTLAPQPGNGTPTFAHAAQDAGFTPSDVRRIIFHNTGFGAMDELTFCH